MQEAVVIADEPWGLPTDEKILPQYFKNAGYETHLIGKVNFLTYPVFIL